MKATLDTNVLVSGTFWTGKSFKILDAIDKGKIKHVTSKEIIEEYYEVINSDEIINKAKDKKLTLMKITDRVIKDSEIVEPSARVNLIKDDPDDNMILECAKAGKVGFIVSKDKHLLKLSEFENIPIITPEEFVRKHLN